MDILLKNGKVHSKEGFIEADLLIECSHIKKISPNILPTGKEKVIDCTGKYLLPGLIDAHVHFREPGMTHKEDFLTGSQAAVAGGVTTILEMPNTIPPTITRKRLLEKRQLAKKSLVNYGIYVLGCPENAKYLKKFDQENLPGIKVFLGSSTGNYLTDDTGIFAEILQNTTLPVVVHAEKEELIKFFTEKYRETKLHHKIRDPLCALTSTMEAVTLAHSLNKKIHLAHLSTKAEIDFLRKNKTYNITCEVAPHHLFLTQEFFLEKGNYGKMNPPLHSKEDQEALWQGIKEGIVDMIATDHAPHIREEKEKDYWSAPSGVPGVQTLLPLLLNAVNENKISLTDVVRLCCTNPAQIFSIKKRGKIEEGYYADLCLVDLEKEDYIQNQQQFSKSGWTPFHNWKIIGWPIMTLVNGQIVYEQGIFNPQPYGQEVQFQKKYSFLGKEISGPFTIPAGIITTNLTILQKIAQEIPEIGVLTTKSIGPSPREGHKEPILTQYAPGCFMNAVGLTNPGVEEFVEQLKTIKIPKDKFLLVSIFGGNKEEFVAVAKKVAPYADGLELNLSCPNVEKLHLAIGQNPQTVKEITQAVKQAISIPVVPKLTPNVSNLKEIAQAAVEGGAEAICAINTVGPGYYTVNGFPVLTNKTGGMSGKGILPIGLKCTKEIREVVDVPLIGCGGISSAEDVKSYQAVGADIQGIGSALAGLTTLEMKEYFSALKEDLKNETNNAEIILKKELFTNYAKYQLVENKRLADDLSLLIFDKNLEIKPGQFIFAWLPGVGEKPFSVLDNQPLTLAVMKRGCFSEKIINLSAGAEVYFRGPYGQPMEIEDNKKIVLVGGGTGLASLYLLAKEYPNHEIEIFFGAKDKNHLYYLEQLENLGKLNIATDDGSVGFPGFVTQLLNEKLSPTPNLIFFNCGPEVMIKKAVEIEKQFAFPINIFSSIDYLTKCGLGLCGSCATKNGLRSCVDGPFLKEN